MRQAYQLLVQQELLRHSVKLRCQLDIDFAILSYFLYHPLSSVYTEIISTPNSVEYITVFF
jgi:hypothetical protein